MTVIRNPLDRAISLYKDKVLGSIEYIGYGFYPSMSFDQFVDVLYHSTDEELDVHFQSYSHRIKYRDRIIPKHVLLFENLPKTWITIQELVKRHTGKQLPALPHLNKTDNTSIEISQEAEQRIRLRYAEDYKIWTM